MYGGGAINTWSTDQSTTYDSDYRMMALTFIPVADKDASTEKIA
jgi:hypothetical protein